MSRRLLLASFLLALSAGSATAQEVRLYRADEAVDPGEVALILDAARPEAPAIKMRSIRVLDDAPKASGTALEPVASTTAYAAATPADATPARPRPSALALPVQFAFDSAEILPAARPQLDALAEGIRMLPGSQSVVIEGHTDAAGPQVYNEGLSQRRAHAVKRYLVALHRIDPSRLRAVGLGEYAPLARRDPYAAENRRVQFRGE